MEHGNDWCFRDIYKCGLRDDVLHVNAHCNIYYWHKVKHMYPTKLKGKTARDYAKL